MAIELVTGHSGAAHVSGADAGAMHAGICGSDSYVLGAVPSVTMSDANTLVIQPCNLMIEGRHVRLSGTNTLSIRSGAQTGKRNDLVYVRYTYDASTGTESAKLGVKEGTTATTATDPALDNPSSVLDGATIADVAICRVSLDALTPTATWLLPQLPTLASMTEQHVVLWSGTRSQSISSSVTLSEPVGNFDALVIEYEGEAGVRSSAYVSDPDGKVVALSTSFRNLWGTNGDAYITDVKAVRISGRTIDTANVEGRGYMTGRVGVNAGSNAGTWSETGTGGSDFIGIVRVTGVRYAKGRA